MPCANRRRNARPGRCLACRISSPRNRSHRRPGGCGWPGSACCCLIWRGWGTGCFSGRNRLPPRRMPRLRLRACRLPRPNRPLPPPIRPHRNRPSSMPASPRRLQPCRRRLRHPPQCRPLRLQPRPCPRPLRRLCRHSRCSPPLCHPLRRRLRRLRRPLPLPFRCRLRRRLRLQRRTRHSRFRLHPRPPRRPPFSRRRRHPPPRP